MTINIAPQQVFDWAIILTEQSVGEALTQVFLGIVETLPDVEKVNAFDVHNNVYIPFGQAKSITDQLIRRYPIESIDEETQRTIENLQDFGENEQLRLFRPQGSTHWAEILVLVRSQSRHHLFIMLTGCFTQAHIELIDKLLLMYKNLSRLHEAKERDLLTSLYNRQSFDRRLMQVCQYFREFPVVDMQLDKSSWIAILDIDHFKSINDNFGHLYGDEVLVSFSQLMEKNFRYNDFFFRFGGEEFVVILNIVSEAEAAMVFERFRLAVANFIFPGLNRQVTVSIGITHLDGHSVPSSVLDRADKALYWAKGHGRNQAVFYERTPGLYEDQVDSEEIMLF